MVKTHNLTNCLGLTLCVLFYLMISPASLASPEITRDNSPIPGLSNKFSRGVQGILGLNRLAAWIGETQIEKQMRKKIEGPMDVDLKPYSAKDLTEGKLRQLTITGQNWLVEKSLYISTFKLQTDAETPLWIDLKEGELLRPVEGKVWIEITQGDMNRSFTEPALQEKLQHIKVPILNVTHQTMALWQPHMTLHHDKLELTGLMGIAALGQSKALPVHLDSGLHANNDKNKIELEHFNLHPIDGVPNIVPVQNVAEQAIEDMLRFKKFIPTEKGRLHIKTLRIRPEGIRIQGVIWLYPAQNSSVTIR